MLIGPAGIVDTGHVDAVGSGRVASEAIADEMWLAYAALVDRGLQWFAGIFATMAWVRVRGGRPAPVTEWDEQPVTSGLARVE